MRRRIKNVHIPTFLNVLVHNICKYALREVLIGQGEGRSEWRWPTVEPEDLLAPGIQGKGALPLSERPTPGTWEQGLCHKSRKARRLKSWCPPLLITDTRQDALCLAPSSAGLNAHLGTENRSAPAFPFGATLVGVAMPGHMNTVPRCAGQKGILSQVGF